MSAKRIKKEFIDLASNPIGDRVWITPDENNIFKWTCTVFGKKNTPFDSGKFLLDICFPSNYPFSPPQIIFATKIFHPNVNESGKICTDSLYERWNINNKIRHILYRIVNLMDNPDPWNPMVPEIAELYSNDQESYKSKAKEWTNLYAKNESL